MKKFLIKTLFFSFLISFSTLAGANKNADGSKSDQHFIDQSQINADNKMTKPQSEAGCIEGKIKFLDGKKEIIENQSFCFDLVVKSFSSAKKCIDKNSSDVECSSNLPGPFSLKFSEVQAERGSVGFKICEKLHGIPQFIEFFAANTWTKTSRCIFSDGSFLDIQSLGLKVKYVD